jgi:hypothetical protein
LPLLVGAGGVVDHRAQRRLHDGFLDDPVGGEVLVVRGAGVAGAGPVLHRDLADAGQLVFLGEAAHLEQELEHLAEQVGGDNLRQWAERMQSARLAQQVDVAGYDPDELAAARGYATLPLAVAAWSSELAATSWVDVVTRALREQVELRHATRGLQRAADVARNNFHDAYHHLWDIKEILAEA